MAWLSRTSRGSLLATLLTGCARSLDPSPAPAPLLGRWTFSFHIMGGVFTTPIELADSAGTLRVYSLGPPLVQFTSARVDGDILRLQGRSRYGGVHVSGRVASDSLHGRWRIKVLRGDVAASRTSATRSTVGSRGAAFDAVRDTLRARYYDSTFGGVRFDSLAADWRPRAVAAPNDGAWLAIVRRMLRALHSSHLDVGAITLAEAFPTRGGGTADEAKIIRWGALTPRVGYLRIKQFDEGPRAIARLDSAFAALRGYGAVVVDVRGNPGGTLGVAMRLGDHLFGHPTPAGSFTTRRSRGIPAVWDGYDVDAFTALLRDSGSVTIVTGGRVPRRYAGRVALLVDSHSGSTTEAFAAVLQELRAATLVGERTAGAMLSSAEVRVDGGWVLRFPEADFRTPAGRRVEAIGVTPDVVAPRHWYRDSQLAAAVSLLERAAR